MRIQNNVAAMNTHRQYGINNANIAKSVEKLSSGYRINRAGDDAAGLAISEKMRAQIRGLNMASKNSQDAVSLVQTAEGALQSSHDILQRMRELAVQASSDTNENGIDRSALDQEFQALKAELDDIAGKTVFNDQKLIDGTFSEKKLVQGSATSLKGAGMTFGIGNASAGTYKFDVDVEAITASAAATAGTSQVVMDSIESTAISVATAGNNAFTMETGVTGAMFNGNYTLSVTDISTKDVEFTLTGDNGKTFSVKFDTTANAMSGNAITLTFSGLGSLKLTLKDDIGGAATSPLTQSQLEYLDDVFDGIKVSVTGGKDKTEATYGVFASITGGEKVQLQVGDDSVSFSNGLTVNFNKLTASDLDTSTSTGVVGAGTNYQTAFGTTTSTMEVLARENQALVIQTGANQGDELAINIDKMDSTFLGVSGSKVSTHEAASLAIKQVNNAVNQVSSQRAALGALQNRLESKIANLDTSAENLQSAESRIRDVDMAKEMSNFTRNNILSQAATAMLAQANSLPQGVLQLLG